MNPPAKLSDLIDCIEIETEEIARYFDRKTGLIVEVSTSLLDAIESDDEDQLADEEKSTLELAQEIMNEAGPDGRFIEPPNRFEFHEYRQIERFIGTLTHPVAVEKLSRAIQGKGAFRHFKDCLDRLNLREQWFSFRDAAIKKYVLRWAADHAVTVDEAG